MKISRRRFLTLASLSAAAVAAPGILRSGKLPAALASEDPFLELDAVAQAALIRKGEATPIELLDAAIRRIDAVNPSVQCRRHQALRSCPRTSCEWELRRSVWRRTVSW